MSNQWYFTTRESGDLGPFPSQDEAKNALHQYLRDLGVLPAKAWDVPGADR